jgi:hypothetical protein
VVGQFFTGFGAEFTRTSNWMGTIASPSVAASLSPTSGESDAMLFGRVAGDVVTIVLGTAEVGGGLTMAGGGAAVGCGTTLCLASAPAAVPGIAVATYRVGTTASGAAGLGENLGRFFATTQQDELNQTDKQTQTSPYGYPDNPSKPLLKVLSGEEKENQVQVMVIGTILKQVNGCIMIEHIMTSLIMIIVIQMVTDTAYGQMDR